MLPREIRLFKHRNQPKQSAETMLNLVHLVFIVSACYFFGDLLTNVEAAKGFTVYENPGCNNASNCILNETKIVQVLVKQPNKTLHFILPGNGLGAPLSIIMLEADVNSDMLKVNWTKFLSRSGGIQNTITLDGVHTSYGFILDEFCPYSDTDDLAKITPQDIEHQCYHMLGKNMDWQLIDNTGGSNPVKFTYTALKSNDSTDKLGNITFSILFPRSEDDLPQEGGLYLAPGMGLIFELSLDGVGTPEHGRIAPIIIPFSQDPVHLTEDFVQTTSLTKDNTETLFNLHLARRKTISGHDDNFRVSGHTPAYMQWQTTCEVTTDGKTKRSVYTAPRIQIQTKEDKKYRYSLPVAYYGDAFVQKITPDAENITVGARLQALTFGSPHDGFYAATNFVRWRGALSMGEPLYFPDRGAQARLAVAIALPLIFLIVAISFTLAIIYKHRRSSPNYPSAQ
ncbi:hypothetical protein Aperf_G00000076676 [Anoplocephala perfoliata]